MRSGAKWHPKHYRLTRQICGRFVHFVETGLPQASISVVFSSLESGWALLRKGNSVEVDKKLVRPGSSTLYGFDGNV